MWAGSDLHHLTRYGDLRPNARLSKTAIMILNPFHSALYPRPRRDIAGIRLAMALCAGIPLLLTFLVPIKRLIFFECPFLSITGLSGPFCGFTRSLWAISAGEWTHATVNCPLAWLLYAALVSGFALNLIYILPGIRMRGPWVLSLTRVQANRAIGILLALVLLNWIYRLWFGLT